MGVQHLKILISCVQLSADGQAVKKGRELLQLNEAKLKEVQEDLEMTNGRFADFQWFTFVSGVDC